MITQKELKEVLKYNPETGIFTWLKTNSRKMRCGAIAGTKDKKGYVRIIINGKKYRAHRLAWLQMTGKWPKNQIDHIDHVRDNNKWFNLREATDKENQKY